MVTILRGRDSGRQVILMVEAVLPGRNIDRRVLAIDFDAELGLITCERCGVGQTVGQLLRRRVSGKSGSGQSLGHQCPGTTR